MENLHTPFFIVGAVRSGTTLLRLLLGHHPDICECHEMEYMMPVIADGADFPDDMNDYQKFLDFDKGFRMSGYSLTPGLDFQGVVNSFFQQRMALDNKPVVGAVVHNHFDQLTRLWPESKYIYVSRDPRDVARSCVQMGWNGTAWGGSQIWLESYEQWKKLTTSVPSGNRMEVAFENLVKNPEAELERICAFLNVSYDDVMLNIDNDTTYSRPNPKAAKSWRDKDCIEDVREVEARVGAQLQEAGYELSGFPILTLTGAKRLEIALRDRYKRVLFRCKRYGVGLWLLNGVSRRFPSKSFRNSVSLKIQEIDIQHHK